MNRPLIIFTVALITGILTAHTINSYLFTIFIAIALTLVVMLVSQKLEYKLGILIAALAFYSLGALEYYSFKHINNSKYTEYAGKHVIVKGYVDQEPDIRNDQIMYTIKTNEIILEDRVDKVSGKLLLTALRKDNGYIYEYGEAIEVAGEINLPQGRRNPGGFDYSRYLMQSGISATIFARNENILPGAGRKINIIVELGNRIRNRIIHIIEESLPKDQAGLLNGMLIGYRNGLSNEIQEAFSDSGLIHIMAVSGAHVSFLMIPFMFIFKRLKVERKISNIIVICILFIYLSITGFQPTVARAVIMATIMLVSQIIWRETDIYTSISIAAIILLVLNPFTLFNIGFQLSFIATISIIMFQKSIGDIIKWKIVPLWAKNVLSITISAQIGVLPITAYYFKKVSIISIISNLLVTPLLEVTSIIGYIMIIIGQFSLGITKLIGYINYIFLSLILIITKACSDLPFATVTVLAPSIFLMVSYYLILWTFLCYKPSEKNKIGKEFFLSILVLIVLLYMLILPANRGVEVVFLDVGSGDSALITTEEGMAVLIDGGGYFTTDEDKNIGDSIIIPFLLSNGIGKLDLVVATHGHEDHIQGLRPVLEDFNIGAFVIPDISVLDEFSDLLDICKQKNIDVIKFSRGGSITLDKKTKISVLNPANEFNSLTASLNNSSLVLKLSHLNVNFLFTGDIEKEAEEDILKAELDLESEVLKVAHHGSLTSSTQAFLEKVKPLVAVISVGRNKFGHPSTEVINRLEDVGAMILRTDIHGAVTIKSNGKNIKIRSTVN